MTHRAAAAVAACLTATALTVGATTIDAGPAGAGSEARRVRAVPESIASDCSVDVTTRLAEFVNRSRRGTTVELAEDGCYRIDGRLRISDRKDLVIDGNGATLRAMTPGDKDRRHVWIWGGRDIVIRDLTVRGAHPDAGAQRSSYHPGKAFQHGFAIQGTRGLLLERVQVYDVYGDFVYVGGELGGDGGWARDVRVTRSTFEGSGRQGIAVVKGERITIDRNRIGGVGLSLFDLEPNRGTGGAIDIRILRNRTGAVRHFWLASKGVGLNVGDVLVKGNTAVVPSAGLVWVYGPTHGYRGPFRFVDNTFEITGGVQDEGSTGAFFVSRVRGVTIEGNTVTLPTGRAMPVVESRDSLDIVLEGNTFVNAGPEIVETRRTTPPTAAAP